jgi:hypothetical protein
VQQDHRATGGGYLLYFGVTPAITQYAGWSVGIPFFAAYDSDLAHSLKWLAATVTMLLGAAVFVALSHTLPATDTAVPTSRPVARTA